jgi:putative transposase
MPEGRYKIRDQEGVYYLTFTVVNWIDVFTRKRYKDI